MANAAGVSQTLERVQVKNFFTSVSEKGAGFTGRHFGANSKYDLDIEYKDSSNSWSPADLNEILIVLIVHCFKFYSVKHVKGPSV